MAALATTATQEYLLSDSDSESDSESDESNHSEDAETESNHREDAETESKIQKAITFLTKGRTTIVIAHRMSTIHNAHEIFVLKDGAVVENGNHDSLIKNSIEYKSLYEKQLK